MIERKGREGGGRERERGGGVGWGKKTDRGSNEGDSKRALCLGMFHDTRISW